MLKQGSLFAQFAGRIKDPVAPTLVNLNAMQFKNFVLVLIPVLKQLSSAVWPISVIAFKLRISTVNPSSHTVRPCRHGACSHRKLSWLRKMRLPLRLRT
jgi:hypothetical protein